MGENSSGEIRRRGLRSESLGVGSSGLPNTADELMLYLQAAGVSACFANPGTTELSMVDALERCPGIRTVLGLHETVCTGAADGYSRLTGRPSLALLHHGPGLANGLANLHNARRGRSPVLTLVGESSEEHNRLQPPLACDARALAGTVSTWVERPRIPGDVEGMVNEAMRHCGGYPGRPAVLLLPDPLLATACEPFAPPPPSEVQWPVVPESRIEAAAEAIRSGPVAFLLAASGSLARGVVAAGRISAATGAQLFCETFPARVSRGIAPITRMPYFPEAALEAFSHFGTVILAGAPEPVTFFDYTPTGGRLIPAEVRVLTLATPEEDAGDALERLAARLNATGAAEFRLPNDGKPHADAFLTPDLMGQVLGSNLPDPCVVVDESLTSGRTFWIHSESSPRHELMALTGGAIGQGLPCAVGAAIASPDRRVVALQADGSGLYSLQSLWTMARERLDITVVICANRAYRILELELKRAGIRPPGPVARRMCTLDGPAPNWVSLADGFGVPGVRVETAGQLERAFRQSFDVSGPTLIEAILT